MTRVRRWNGAVVAVVVLVGLGLLTASRTPLVAAVVPLTYLAYSYLSIAPALTGVDVTRSIEPTDPDPGDEVTVQLSITNRTGGSLPDLRVVDGVPDDLAVVSGSPRAAVALRPDGTARLEYDVVAARGEFAFEDPIARSRGLAASGRLDTRLSTDGDDGLECTVGVESVPLRDRTTAFPGSAATDSGGEGIEFHATREYRTGDPISRVDWRGYAKRGELATVEFRERRAAQVVVVADLRGATDVAARPGVPTARELAAYGAVRTVGALARARHAVGAAALGVAGDHDALAVVDPGTGRTARVRAERLFGRAVPTLRSDRTAADDAVTHVPSPDGTGGGDPVATTDGDAVGRTVADRLSPNAQVILFSPFVDGFPERVVATLDAQGYPVTVVAPDPTDSTGPDGRLGDRLGRAERATRLHAVTTTGVPVVDWDRETPLALAVERALASVRAGAGVEVGRRG